MHAEIWKDREVAKAFLTGRSVLIPDRQRQLEVLLRVVQCFCPQPRQILDLGSGDAILLATCLEAFPSARGVALDFSPIMLEQARQRLASFGPRATTRERDLQSPSWKDGISEPVDLVISGLAIHHLTHERKRAIYREIYLLLAPGGVFLNCELVASPTPRIEGIFDDVMSEHLYHQRKEKGEAVTPEQARQDYVKRPDRAANILAPVEDQCNWLRQIGFQEVDCFWKYFELTIFGGIK